MVPYCNTFEGHGSIPPGHELLIFAQAAVPGRTGTGGYAYEGSAKPGDGNWSISNITLGARNQTGHGGELTALLVTRQLAILMKPSNIHTEPTAYVELMSLPLGIRVGHFDYTRNSDTARCPP